MDVTAIWQGQLQFQAAGTRGTSLMMDASRDVGGDENGFSPLELVAIGLAGCTAIDVISILRKKRQDVTAFEVRVHAEKAAEHPQVFTQITIEYVLTGRNIAQAAVERAIELTSTKYCPVQAMLKQAAPIELRYTISEAGV